MKRYCRSVAVCTVGLVLALLLGGLSGVDQIHSAVSTGAGTVYAAQSGTAPACFESRVGINLMGLQSSVRLASSAISKEAQISFDT